MSLPSDFIYEFEDFRLDLAEKVLLRDGNPIPITPKVFDTLQVFLEHAGQLIEKNELMERIWRERFVEESNLTFNIKMLRKALGDDAAKPKFVETVPRRGYRFIADVRKLHAGTAGNGFSTLPEPVSSPPNTSETISARTEPVALPKPSMALKFNLMLGACVLIAVASLALGYYFSKRTVDGAAEGVVKIAVLPLTPIDSANRSEIYEIGIADSLINKINSMRGVFARPLNAVRKYADLNQDALAAGKEQQVDFVLAANYQLVENRLRVTWHLIKVANGQSEDTEAFETNSDDLFRKQDAVVADIGNKLTKRFGTTFRSNAINRGTANEGAYRLYLQGMYLYDRRTTADALRAVEKLSEAIDLDPGYALAWAGKAHVHRSLGNFGGSISPHEQYRLSMAAAKQAISIDVNLSDAYSALCENKFFYEYDYEGAERECKRAVELDPNSYLAHEIYARCLWTLSRFDEAITEVKLAIDIEPTSLFSQRNLGISLFYARRYDEAVHQFRRVSDMDPNFVANYHWFVPALLVRGNKEEAFDAFIRWQTLMKVDESDLQQYRFAYRSDGWRGVGRERVKRFDLDKIRSYFLEACLTAHTGDDDKTIEYLEKSLQRREWGIPFLLSDPSLDGIRDHPRFKDIANRVEVAHIDIEN